jgi:hypothetical protein
LAPFFSLLFYFYIYLYYPLDSAVMKRRHSVRVRERETRILFRNVRTFAFDPATKTRNFFINHLLLLWRRGYFFLLLLTNSRAEPHLAPGRLLFKDFSFLDDAIAEVKKKKTRFVWCPGDESK